MNSSFVRVEYAKSHPGVERLERAFRGAGQIRQSLEGGRGLAAVLLAAMVSAMIVVADQLISQWAEGHILAAWVMLWLVGFGALALLAPAARALSRRLMARLDAWSHALARRRADERLWELAKRDPRIMTELEAARSRQQM